ncbi:MAG: dethiobiotin synthase [Lutimonas sp.]
MRKIFITGIGTDVGKTVVAAIVTEALKADYWKPIQAGDLEFSDTDRVRSWVTNDQSVFHPNSYALKTPMSPHAAAEIDGIRIQLNKIQAPLTSNDLVIEGAGGLLVPLNEKDTIQDLIQDDYKILVVARNYLGSINHTLLTLDALRARGRQVSGVIFNGEEVPSTESIVETLGGVPVLGRLDWAENMDAAVVSKYAELLRPKLENLR